MPKEPHILIAGSNVLKLRRNLLHILDANAIALIDGEIHRTVAKMFNHGESFFNFARQIDKAQWRHAMSRLYYAAYNCTRAIRLAHDGIYSTDPSEHSRVGELPDSFPNNATYAAQLRTLRTDRNLCDYDHAGTETDLIISRADATTLVEALIRDGRTFLGTKGFKV